MAKKESTFNILLVAFVLCVVCSVLVSTAAVVLKPAQIVNKALDFKRNVLTIASIDTNGRSIEEVYAERIEARIVNLETGKFTDEYSAENFDQIALSKDPVNSIALAPADDLGKILRRENYSVVYLLNDEAGNFDKLILPVRGKGLWSTMSGLIILEKDLNTVSGFGYYEHGETPGLGGEVDNPSWRALWEGKKVFNEEGEPVINVVKTVNPAEAEHQIDSLSGATLTSNGVRNSVRFWLGEHGFKRFLTNFENGEA